MQSQLVNCLAYLQADAVYYFLFLMMEGKISSNGQPHV